MPTSGFYGPLVKETVSGSDVFTCFNAIVILYHFPAIEHVCKNCHFRHCKYFLTARVSGNVAFNCSRKCFTIPNKHVCAYLKGHTAF